MKIAFIVGYFPLLSETFVVNQIIGLIARGHEVDIYGTEPIRTDKLHPYVENYHLLARTHYQEYLPQNYFWRLLTALKLIMTNFHKAPLVILRSLNIFRYGRAAASLKLLYAAIPLLKSKEYDIIHCQFGTHGITGMRLREIGAIKGKLITSFRGYDISSFVQVHGEHVYNQLFAKGDYFLANCEYFHKKAIELGCDAQKIVVHTSGVDCDRFPFKERHRPHHSQIRIVTTGRLVEKKGIEYGIRAVAKLAKRYPNIEYKIIGDGELKEHFQQLIEKLQITEKVKLLSWKNQPEIIEILDNSDIFMAPSVTASDGNQDAPVNTLKEAMLMGLPVIGTHHGGIPELVKDGISGFLVPERDAEAIADKITYLIEHPEIWLQMGKAGRAHVEAHYDINKLSDELVEIYQQVMFNNLQLQESAPILTGSLNYQGI